MKQLSKLDFLKRRKNYICGSDIAAIFSDSKYSSPLQLYQDKLSEDIDLTTSEAADMGSRMEETVAQFYAEDTGNKVTIDETFFVHPKYSWAGANIDRWVNDGEFILECKTISDSHYNSLMGNSDHEYPDSWLYQVAWYCFVLDKPKADIACIIGGNKFRIHTYERNIILEQKILYQASKFWNDHVLKMIPPEPTVFEDLKIKYPNKDNDKTVTATDELIKDCYYLAEIKKSIEIMQKEKSDLELKIANFIGESGSVLHPNEKIIATHKKYQGRKTIDINNLKIDHPDIYIKYLKENAEYWVFKFQNKWIED